MPGSFGTSRDLVDRVPGLGDIGLRLNGIEHQEHCPARDIVAFRNEQLDNLSGYFGGDIDLGLRLNATGSGHHFGYVVDFHEIRLHRCRVSVGFAEIKDDEYRDYDYGEADK